MGQPLAHHQGRRVRLSPVGEAGGTSRAAFGTQAHFRLFSHLAYRWQFLLQYALCPVSFWFLHYMTHFC